MSKNIKAGSWWLDVDGDIVYVAFVERELPFERDEATFLCYYRRGMSDSISVIWHTEDCLIRELPGCTGFDYKEPIVAPNNLPHNPLMDGPPQWIPVTVGDGDQYLFLGYQCQPVDATAG